MSMSPHLKKDQSNQSGFSLIEVLIGLVLSGLLMSMVAMVLGQSITNSEVVRSSSGLSSRMFTLRRILHRDLQNIVIATPIVVDETGIGFSSVNNFLLDGAFTVDVAWDFSGNMIRRHEESGALQYSNSFQLMRGLSSWRIELLDAKSETWISAAQYRNRPLGMKSGIKALRMNLSFEDGQNLIIVERVPYVLN
ncbi:PulJ/GspJ family protein [Maridesulfovibrio hydrothermalis]|uniref:Prepilin-type N-terminal cleavage/methylation domain-containing protein n=1 Tax=Maridesulfovibrio hydrothermalis AM13 = DSM 14728 TaxID=1121451 RepID=L0R928_9BACT|nr:prepilin-type N-terminal cleavage/methylation domain-containing protein [Maridesulfovibrio hydrothermalis]CCO23259.1 conserved exported protein of unknown function [Maridesulfovibrio hydrothermalis AM13 = DSM 14728]